MNGARLAAGVFLAALLTTGCYHTDRTVTRAELAPEWVKALEQPGNRSVDIEGYYEDAGESLIKTVHTMELKDGKKEFPAIRSVTHLAGMGGYRHAGDKRPKLTVELSVLAPNQLHFTVREGPRIVAERTVLASWSATDHAWVLQHEIESVAGAGGHSAGMAVQWHGTRLFKGADGALYLHGTGGTLGMVLFVLPTSDHGETWCRWKPLDVARPAR